MRACISTSRATLLAMLLCGIAGIAAPVAAQAQYSQPRASQDADDGNFLSGPFSEFGEFSGDEDEEADEKFFAAGRFFGVGLGVGLTTTTGNAGRLYQGGFPAVDLRLLYWFDFFVALQIVGRNSVHTYDVEPDKKTNTNLFRVLAQVKWYIDTKDLSAPLTFIGPHLIVGGGMYRRTDNLQEQGVTETANAFGLNFGGGLELTIKPKKFYLTLESVVNMMTFRDAYDPRFIQEDPLNGIEDRTGMWIDTTVSVTWTW